MPRSSQVPDLLTATIKARVQKGHEHYLAAGLHLIEAKQIVSTTPGLTWPAYCVSHLKIGRKLADELIAYATDNQV